MLKSTYSFGRNLQWEFSISEHKAEKQNLTIIPQINKNNPVNML